MPKRTKAENTAEAGSDELRSSEDVFSESEEPQEEAASSGNGLADSVKQAATEAASQTKEAASRVMDQAKNEAAVRADQQRETVATGVQADAHAFRNMGEDLRKREQGPVPQYAAQMGDSIGAQVERFAEYLRGRDVHQLVADAEDFARRSPAIFLGGAFVLGLAVSRFLKSSRPTAQPDSGADRGSAEWQSEQQSGQTSSPALRERRTMSRPQQSAGMPGSGSGLDPAGGI